MKFCRMPFSEIITFLCDMQVHIFLWYWIAWVNSIYSFASNDTPETPETTVFTSEHVPEFNDIKKQCQVVIWRKETI